MTLEEFFVGDADEPSHPRVRDWKRRIEEGQPASLELYRPAAMIGLSRTQMFVHFTPKDKPAETYEQDWDRVLNEGLIQLGVRAIDNANEAMRFVLGLRDGFQVIEKEFGNGFFNSVLLDLVAESGLNKYADVDAVLKHIARPKLERSVPYERCREAIALSIGARAKELTKKLGYPQPEASEILAGAIAKYLDERFSVTSRKQFGLLPSGQT